MKSLYSILNTNKNIYELMANMMLISGLSRSGTTILGKLIHSAKDVEYSFEPHIMRPLFAQISDMDKEMWKVLFEVYCLDEVFIGNLTGRKFNFNKNDKSNIHHSKPKDLIHDRLDIIYRWENLEDDIIKYRLCIKYPNILPYLPTFQDYYPTARLILTVRKANDVINSNYKRGWFTNISMKGLYSNMGYCFYVHNGLKVSDWVQEKDWDWWCQAQDIERIAYTYIVQMEAIDQIKDKIIVNYHELVQSPQEVIGSLFSGLDIKPTDMTKKIMKEVTPRYPENKDLVSRLPMDMRRKIASIEERYFLVKENC